MRRLQQRGRRGPQHRRAAAAAVHPSHRWTGQGPPASHHLPRQQQLPSRVCPGVPPTAALPHLCALVSIVSSDDAAAVNPGNLRLGQRKPAAHHLPRQQQRPPRLSHESKPKNMDGCCSTSPLCSREYTNLSLLLDGLWIPREQIAYSYPQCLLVDVASFI